MRDSTAKVLTNHAMIDSWRSRAREVKLYSFVYTWFHVESGKRGIGTIKMRSYEKLVAWMAKWNHTGATSGWNYSLFDSSV